MARAPADPDTLTRAEEEALARAKRSVSQRSGSTSGKRTAARKGSSGGRAAGTRRRRTGGRRGAARLESLDLLRGLAVVASVLLVAGTAPATLPPWAAPTPWHGFTAADLVLPVFLVVAGVSLAYADARRERAPTWRRVGRVLRRTLVLVALGLGLSWLADPDLETLRWTGLLQRIGLASLVAWLLTRAPRSWQAAGVLTILVGWWFALERVTVPGAGRGVVAPAANVARWLDTSLVDPRHLVAPTDPLGPTTTLPAALLVVAGVWSGRWLRSRPAGPATAVAMAVAAGWLVVLAVGWAQVTPLNASLWTPPYVLFAAGVALALLAAAYLATDVLPVGRVLTPIRVLGRNPLVAYLVPAAAVAWLSRPDSAGESAWERTWEGFFAPVFGDLGGLALGAGLLAATVWIVTALDRRGWHLRA